MKWGLHSYNQLVSLGILYNKRRRLPHPIVFGVHFRFPYYCKSNSHQCNVWLNYNKLFFLYLLFLRIASSSTLFRHIRLEPLLEKAASRAFTFINLIYNKFLKLFTTFSLLHLRHYDRCENPLVLHSWTFGEGVFYQVCHVSDHTWRFPHLLDGSNNMVAWLMSVKGFTPLT